MPDTVKHRRFEAALGAAEFDVVVAASPDNTWYLSDAIIDTQRGLPERLALVVWAKSAPPIYIVCTNEEIQARRETWIRDLRGYIEYRQSPMQLLAQALTELGAARGTVGIERHFLTVHYYGELVSLLPKARFVEAGPFFDRVRAVKTPEEIGHLERAAQATDRAIRTAFEAARPGMTERQVGVRMSSELILAGAEMQAFQVLAAGMNSCSTHARAGDYVLRPGDLMRTDFGGVFPGGYCSDLARTIAVGEASRRQRDTYAAIWEEHERLIGMLRPGATCREIYESHKAAWRGRGWPMMRPHIGHSLGIGLHERPLLMPSDGTPLVPGMCMAIEPTYLVPEVEKYHVEDLILVTDGMPRVLSRPRIGPRSWRPAARSAARYAVFDTTVCPRKGTATSRTNRDRPDRRGGGHR
jgi:Xaa-Pro aminopeptidase